jgi:hypothetical protein
MTHRFDSSDNRIARSRRLISVLCIAALGLLLVAGKTIPKGEEFGAGVQLGSVTSMKEIINDPTAYKDKTILVSGRISDVCQKKGCWTVLQEGDLSMRIRFKDYGFFVPMDSSGRQAFVEGVVKVETLSQGEARHFAGESIGGDPSQIHGPQREIGFTASGVRILAREPAPR